MNCFLFLLLIYGRFRPCSNIDTGFLCVIKIILFKQNTGYPLSSQKMYFDKRTPCVFLLVVLMSFSCCNCNIYIFRRSRDNSLGEDKSDCEIPSILKRRASSDDIGLEVIVTQIYICKPEIFKTNVSNRVLSVTLPFEFVFSCCQLTKVILYSKSLFEMLVLQILVYKR